MAHHRCPMEVGYLQQAHTTTCFAQASPTQRPLKSPTAYQMTGRTSQCRQCCCFSLETSSMGSAQLVSTLLAHLIWMIASARLVLHSTLVKHITHIYPLMKLSTLRNASLRIFFFDSCNTYLFLQWFCTVVLHSFMGTNSRPLCFYKEKCMYIVQL